MNQKIPEGFIAMDHQVAGHTFHVGTDEIGMLKSNDDGSVLKPSGSPMCAAREIKFYEQLLTTTDKDILPLREFTAEYRGTQTLTIGTKTVNFIKLRDLTHGMLEPCAIDMKIGRRTWDPLATEAKRSAEDSKYVNCKNTVGFCIPGFQTFHIESGNYKKFGKEYGKKLNENTVKDGEWLKIILKN
jgi:1D-myo-inositol-tetrakisphosphate 5-kinase/inositol-polyphosphate multikinase